MHNIVFISEAYRSTWSDPAYQAVAKLVERRAGLTFSPHRCPDAEAGIRRAMARAGQTDLRGYYNSLSTRPDNFDALVDLLTVGETYFFRDPGHFEFIRTEILPGLRRSLSPELPLRIWCAGCASGEEAYSLAILLEEEGLQEKAHILATDISRAAISCARKGVYSSWSLRAVKPEVKASYFARSGGNWAIAERFRKRVDFRHLNLASDEYPALRSGAWEMDIILCRNVMIYFSAAAVDSVAGRLMDSLAYGGWLITGPSDPPLNHVAGAAARITPAGVFYQRQRLAAAVVPATSDSLWPALAGTSSAGVTPNNETMGNVSSGALGDSVDLPRLNPEGVAAPAEGLVSAEVAFQSGDYELAARLAEELPHVIEASVLQVRAQANHAGSAAAARMACDLVARHPLAPELHYVHALLLADLGHNQQAVQSLRRAIYLDRTLALAHFTLATLLRCLGDFAGATRSFANAYHCASQRPADEAVPLADGETMGNLARAASAQLAALPVAP